MESDAMLMDDAGDDLPDCDAPTGIPHDLAIRLLDGYERLCREQALLAQPGKDTPPGMLDEIAFLLHDTHDTLLGLLLGAPLTLPPSILNDPHLHRPLPPPLS